MKVGDKAIFARCICDITGYNCKKNYNVYRCSVRSSGIKIGDIVTLKSEYIDKFIDANGNQFESRLLYTKEADKNWYFLEGELEPLYVEEMEPDPFFLKK